MPDLSDAIQRFLEEPDPLEELVDAALMVDRSCHFGTDRDPIRLGPAFQEGVLRLRAALHEYQLAAMHQKAPESGVSENG